MVHIWAYVYLWVYSRQAKSIIVHKKITFCIKRYRAVASCSLLTESNGFFCFFAFCAMERRKHSQYTFNLWLNPSTPSSWLIHLANLCISWSLVIAWGKSNLLPQKSMTMEAVLVWHFCLVSSSSTKSCDRPQRVGGLSCCGDCSVVKRFKSRIFPLKTC